VARKRDQKVAPAKATNMKLEEGGLVLSDRTTLAGKNKQAEARIK